MLEDQEFDDCNNFSENNKVESFTKLLLKGLNKCLEDYQGEFKHMKLIIKEVFIYFLMLILSLM